MKSLTNLKYKIGYKLLKWGAILSLSSDKQKEKFKDKINNNTTTGSVCGSGDHLRGYVQPMCDYDTQSVVNVLTQELMVSGDIWIDGHKTSKRIEYYKEEWT